MTLSFEIIQTGTLATVQDIGRLGYRKYGMVTAGAVDAFSLQAGNLLVGNRRDEAALEIAMGGLVLRALADKVVAITGADLQAAVDNKSAPIWKSFTIRCGQELSFRRPKAGVWSYLCMAGGIDVPIVMGSKSTYMRGNIGGLGGRAIKRGDRLHSCDAVNVGSSPEGRGLASAGIPVYSGRATVRVVLGPQEDAFTSEAVETLLSSEYEVTPQSDRMGYRLKGAILRHVKTADILSDALAPGAIQVPSDGLPIVLLADHQTTGGYAKIATVISADLAGVAQLPPGGKVRFESITVDKAQTLAVNREHFLSGLQAACGVP